MRLYIDEDGEPTTVAPKVTRGAGHLGVVRQFIDIIRGGDWAAHIGREGLRRAQIIDACYRSAQEGREIRLTDLAEVM